MPTALTTAVEAIRPNIGCNHIDIRSLKFARIRRPSGPSARELHDAARKEAVAEWAFIDDAFEALPDALKKEQKLLGLLLWHPEAHVKISCRWRDFADPCHQRICLYSWALWRLKQPASANAVGDCVRNITPLLQGGDQLSPIETLVFETLGWKLDEYCIELERRRDHANLLQ